MKTNTITKYVCEYCGAEYDDKSKASECEKRCASIEANAKRKESRRAEISAAVDSLTRILQKYYNDYKEIPPISIKVSRDNSDIKNISSIVRDYFL